MNKIQTMRGISLWEPWASAMAVGLKKNETRPRATHIRGDLVICAAKRPIDSDGKKLLPLLPAFSCPNYGCAVAVVRLIDCIGTWYFHAQPERLDELERAFGNYALGRFAWLTSNVRKLKTPVPVRGKQGFFFISDDVAEQIAKQL